nr:MAG TPA: chromosome partition protein [Caudoviricetes sp.]
MKLNRVTIDNFRNIGHAEYSLEDINIFQGPNRQGKTNTILAIYWAITDFLMDGSSDYASFKPLDDTKKKVSVELEFDTFKFKKEYFEKWTKTRGSETETMTGHYTDYYIDDIKTAPTNAKKDLIQKFGVEGKTNVSKFDLLRAIIDPYYLAKNDWKVTRKFIIELVGDVENTAVINDNPELEPVANRLAQDWYNTDQTKKYYKQQINNSNDDITRLEGQIEGLQMVKDVSSEDLQAAQVEIENIDAAIANTKVGKKDTSISDALQKELTELQQQALDMETAERAEHNAQMASVREERANAQAKIAEAQKAKDDARNEVIRIDNEATDIDLKINRLKLDIGDKEKRLERLRNEYKNTKAQSLQTEEITCPNCGYVLNQDAIEAEKQHHDERLEQLLNDGKNASLELQNAQFKLEELQKQSKEIELKQAPAHSAMNRATEALQACENDYRAISERPYIASIELNNLKSAVNAKQAELKNQRLIENQDTSMHDTIARLQAQKELPQQTLNQHHAFIANQEQIAKVQEQIKAEQKSLMNCEQSLALVERFIQLKLQAFQARIESVFGTKVRFTLIENNIKEGSWNEVCYPSVCDKETPFLNGSGSEQIIAGIYIAECIKKKLGIEDLPLIFDECDKLDTQSLKALETNAQIITTKVNDVQHKKLTLVAKKGR